jgi:hypothetical protein
LDKTLKAKILADAEIAKAEQAENQKQPPKPTQPKTNPYPPAKNPFAAY